MYKNFVKLSFIPSIPYTIQYVYENKYVIMIQEINIGYNSVSGMADLTIVNVDV